MLQKWLQKILEAVSTAIFSHNHYLLYVTRYGLYFGNPNIAYDEIHLGRCLTHCYVPTFLHSLFVTRFLLILGFSEQLKTPEQRAWLFEDRFPAQIAFDIEFITVLICIMPLLFIWYIFQLNPRNYHVLALWVVKPDGEIRPQDLKLTNWEYDKFARFRAISLSLVRMSTGAVWAFSLLLNAVIIYYKGMFEISPEWTLFWMLILSVWVLFLIAGK